MTEEEKNTEMQVRISARLGVLKNLGRDKGDAASVAKIEEELEWLCSLFDCEKDLALTWEDIRTICLLTIGAEIVRDKPDLVDNVQEKLEQVFYEDVLRRFRETKNK